MDLNIGHKICCFDSLTSTNDYLNKHLSQFSEGEIIITKNQHTGRGLGKNKWESEPGKNLTFSFYILPTTITADQQFYLNMVISLGVFDFIHSIVADQKVKVKWPNDIYINARKVGGILINHAISGNQILHSVIGIGINVNQTKFLCEAPNPVSLKQLLGKDLNLDFCLSSLCNKLNTRHAVLQKGYFSTLKIDYISALFGSGEWRLYKFKEETISAKIEGISEYGLLELITQNGNKIECDLKEIEFIV